MAITKLNSSSVAYQANDNWKGEQRMRLKDQTQMFSKVRTGPAGVHIFDRITGLNILCSVSIIHLVSRFIGTFALASHNRQRKLSAGGRSHWKRRIARSDHPQQGHHSTQQKRPIEGTPGHQPMMVFSRSPK